MLFKYFFYLIFSLLALSSCAKKEGSTRRSAQPEPDGGLTITIDSTWDGDTTLYLKP